MQELDLRSAEEAQLQSIKEQEAATVAQKEGMLAEMRKQEAAMIEELKSKVSRPDLTG